MKVLKGLGFFLLALLVFCGFITPFSIVPANFEEEARAKTLERLEVTGTEVDESYINASVEEAIHSNLGTIYRTTVIIALAAAFIICLLALRPPHDCGGVNLFNPLAIPLIIIVSICTVLSVSLALDAIQGQGVYEFRQLVENFSADYTAGFNRLLAVLIIPLMLEIIFRGYIFSFLEKLHFSVAIALSAVMYGLAAYYIFSGYGMRSIGSAAGAEPAMITAFFIGIVLGVMTWRLRSVIPAAIAHVVIANSSTVIEKLRGSSIVSLPLVLIVLATALALMIFLPVLLAKKVPLFAYDYPFTAWHKRMSGLLGGRKKRGENGDEGEASEGEPERAAGSADLPNLIADDMAAGKRSAAGLDTHVVVTDAAPRLSGALPAREGKKRPGKKSGKGGAAVKRTAEDIKAAEAEAVEVDAEEAVNEIENAVFEEVKPAQKDAVKKASGKKPAGKNANAEKANTPGNVPAWLAGIIAWFGFGKDRNKAEKAPAKAKSESGKAPAKAKEKKEEVKKAPAKAKDKKEEVKEAPVKADKAKKAQAKAEDKQKAETETSEKDKEKTDARGERTPVKRVGYFTRRKRKRERAAKRALRKVDGPGPDTLEFSKRAVARALKLKAAADRAERNLAEMADKASKAIADSTKDEQ